MRTKAVIIREINKVQSLCDKLIMEIGQDNSTILRTNDNTLVPLINQKTDTYKKAELQLIILEQELAKMKE